MGKNKIFNLVLFSQALLLLLLPNMAMALSAGGVGVTPAKTDKFPPRTSWFIYEVDAGDVIEDEAIILNTSDTPMHVALEGLDAFLTRDGALTLVGGPDDNEDIGTWITLEESGFDLPPQSQIVVPFTITVPENAAVGDHIGGLTVYESEKEPEKTIKKGGTSVGISTRVGARIYLTVAGDIIRDWTIRKKLFFWSW